MIAKNTMNKELAINSVTSQYGHTTSSFSEKLPFINVPFSAVINKICKCIIFVTLVHINIKYKNPSHLILPIKQQCCSPEGRGNLL
jgi:hypothetical protein